MALVYTAATNGSAILLYIRCTLRNERASLKRRAARQGAWVQQRGVSSPPPSATGLSRAISGLTPGEQKIASLLIQGHEPIEIAGFLGITPEATRKRIQELRRRLKGFLGED